jgi:hypothetical protein
MAELEPNKGTEVPGETGSATANPTEFDQKRDEAIKTKARGLGWKPKSEYDGDPAEWRPAKEFVERQSFFDKIKSVKDDLYHTRRENKQLQKDLDTIKEYVKQMSEVEYKRAVSDLQAQKQMAVQEANVDAVKDIDKQIDQLKETRVEVKQTQVSNEPPPEFNEWVSKNAWYNNDEELRSQADEFGYGILAKNKNLPPIEVLRQIEIKVKKMYPEKFPMPTKKGGAAAVEPGGMTGTITTKKTKLSEGDLDDVQRTAMNTFVKRGVLTKEQYLDSLAKSLGMK